MSERVLICGDREWSDYDALAHYIHSLPADAVVIHGNARGADALAGQIAEARGLDVLVFPAQWDKFGKAAGPIRNQQMLDEGQPTRVAYAHRNLRNSKGTKDMVRRANQAKVPVESVDNGY